MTGTLTVEHLGVRAPNGHSGPNGTHEPLTIFEALQVLERQSGGPNAGGKPGPGRSRGDPARFLTDIIEICSRLPSVIAGLENDRTSISARAALWDLLLKLKESSALAGASVILDQCWRIESTLTGVGTGELTDAVLANIRGVEADLQWLIAQVEPASPPHDEPDHGADKVEVNAESFSRLITEVSELLVRSGGHLQRSRRMGQAIQDIGAAGDRLRRATPAACQE